MTTDAQILTALRTNTDGVSGAQLAEQLGISRAAIWARINELRTLGYEISASPVLGYRLESAPDLLHADDLLSRLSGGWGERPREPMLTSQKRLAGTLALPKVIGRDIRVFRETTSTNDVMEKLARDGVKEGVVVFAESQTKGRGRLGRKWTSPAKRGLWFSVLLRPDLRPQEATRLTVASATALARAIRLQTGLLPDIKWPNDILLRGRKVAGILTEMSAEVDKVRHVILGVGVDVNLTAAEFPADLRKIATSLKIELGGSVDRAELAAVILRELDRDYTRIGADKFPALADEWESRCVTLGRNVTIHVGDRTVQGRAESLDDDGALLVRTQHGRLERITGGDVILEK